MIYADYAASAPISKRARAYLLESLDVIGNPSSVHALGRRAGELVWEARCNVAKLIGADPDEIYFTSGGTEADNLALLGGFSLMRECGRVGIVSSSIEHAAVMRSVERTEKLGADVSYISANERDALGESTGRVRTEDFEGCVTDGTGIVSLMLINNETGVLEPVSEVADIAHRSGALMFTDAVQAVGHVHVDVRELGVDMLSLSGHKFGAPAGIGALYVKRGIKIPPIIVGGDQEGGIRGGTNPVSLIAALGGASLDAMEGITEWKRVCALRDMIARELLKIDGARMNGATTYSPVGIMNISFENVGGEELQNVCSLRGLCIGTGAACHSGEGEPSRALISMGIDRERALSSVRISIGAETSESDARKIVSVVSESVKLIRES